MNSEGLLGASLNKLLIHPTPAEAYFHFLKPLFCAWLEAVVFSVLGEHHTDPKVKQHADF